MVKPDSVAVWPDGGLTSNVPLVVIAMVVLSVQEMTPLCGPVGITAPRTDC